MILVIIVQLVGQAQVKKASIFSAYVFNVSANIVFNFSRNNSVTFKAVPIFAMSLNVDPLLSGYHGNMTLTTNCLLTLNIR